MPPPSQENLCVVIAGFVNLKNCGIWLYYVYRCVVNFGYSIMEFEKRCKDISREPAVSSQLAPHLISILHVAFIKWLLDV